MDMGRPFGDALWQAATTRLGLQPSYRWQNGPERREIEGPEIAPVPFSAQPMNSSNHKRKGQNVLFNNGHVIWETTPFRGHAATTSTPAQPSPAPTSPSPADRYDSVLSPMFPLKGRVGRSNAARPDIPPKIRPLFRRFFAQPLL